VALVEDTEVALMEGTEVALVEGTEVTLVEAVEECSRMLRNTKEAPVYSVVTMVEVMEEGL
jgi:hypothetical protein